jgi:hypothetical protein
MTGVDLSDLIRPGDEIVKAIDAAVEHEHEEEAQERVYLGASVIGDPCERRLWYGFRWAHEPERFSGRMLRLFRNGHEKEAIIIADMRRAGMDVSDRDPATGDQWELSAIGGHFRCHPDGYVTGVPTAPVVRHLLEVKTHKAASFREVEKHGVEAAQPKHWAQMQVGCTLSGCTRWLYMPLNKDDEALAPERGKADPAAGARLLAKAERIITADAPPAKIRESAEDFPCRFCPAVGICHRGNPARRNCRTCLESSPVMDGAGGWECALHGPLDVEKQRAGCADHRYLPGLVAGELVDVDEADETLTYRMHDGSTWVDGRAAA